VLVVHASYLIYFKFAIGRLKYFSSGRREHGSKGNSHGLDRG
jgi:hypothetical protein